MKTHDIETALFNAHGRTVSHNGHKYKLSATYTDAIYPYKRTVFSCHALDLTPTTPEEAKFCLWDFMASNTDDSAAIMLKFAKLGGYCRE